MKFGLLKTVIEQVAIVQAVGLCWLTGMKKRFR